MAGCAGGGSVAAAAAYGDATVSLADPADGATGGVAADGTVAGGAGAALAIVSGGMGLIGGATGVVPGYEAVGVPAGKSEAGGGGTADVGPWFGIGGSSGIAGTGGRFAALGGAASAVVPGSNGGGDVVGLVAVAPPFQAGALLVALGAGDVGGCGGNSDDELPAVMSSAGTLTGGWLCHDWPAGVGVCAGPSLILMYKNTNAAARTVIVIRGRIDLIAGPP